MQDSHNEQAIGNTLDEVQVRIDVHGRNIENLTTHFTTTGLWYTHLRAT